MKYYTTYLIIYFCVGYLSAQKNLIPNAGFEEYYDCAYSIFRDDLKNVIPNWQARVASPRYINWECLGFPGNDQPVPPDFHRAREGNAYCVLVFGPNSGVVPDYRQYLEVELSDPIQQNKDYYLSYWLTLPLVDQNPLAPYGVLFTDSLANETIDFTPPYIPILADAQLEIDTVPDLKFGQWNKFSHCFTASETHSVMTLGIFSELDSMLNKENTKNGLTYLGYDDLLLVEIEKDVRLEEYPDTICAGDCITLRSNHTLIPGSFNWLLPGSDLDSSSDSIVTVCYSSPGTFDISLEVEHCTGRYEGNFVKAITVIEGIEHGEPEIKLKCHDEKVTIVLPDHYQAMWLDGFQQKNREIILPGQYAYELSNGYCSDTFVLTIQDYNIPSEEMMEVTECPGDTFVFKNKTYTEVGVFYDTITGTHGCDSVYHEIRLKHYPRTQLEYDGNLFFCEKEETTIALHESIKEVIWSDGDRSTVKDFSSEGRYQLTYIDTYGCTYQDEILIEKKSSPTVLTNDMIDIGFIPNLPLDVEYMGDIKTYSWHPSDALHCSDCPYPQMIIPREGIFKVKVENQWGCTDVGLLTVEFLKYNTYVPNVLNTNTGIAPNRQFYLRSNVDFLYEMEVYNRWGGLVFKNDHCTSNDPEDGWNPDSQVQDGVYVYKIVFMELDDLIVLSGDVTVIK